MSDYYNRQGEKVDLLVWANLYEDRSYRFLADEKVGEVRVATVWTGTDFESFFDDTVAPQIFSTMIFGGPHNEREWFYASEAEAIAGHAAAVELART